MTAKLLFAFIQSTLPKGHGHPLHLRQFIIVPMVMDCLGSEPILFISVNLMVMGTGTGTTKTLRVNGP